MSDDTKADGAAEGATNPERAADGVSSVDLEQKIEVMQKEMENLKKERDLAQQAQARKDEEKKLAEEAAERAERDKLSETEKLRHDLNTLNQNLTVERNTAKAKDFLAERGLPGSFAKYLDMNASNIDEQLNMLSSDLSEFKTAAAKDVMKNSGTGGVNTGAGVKQKLYSDMSAAEKMALKAENPVLYDQLRNKG